MLVNSTRFGEVEIDEGKIITFEEGIPGFEHCTRYALLSSDAVSGVHWLQAIDDPMVSLSVLDIMPIMTDYSPFVPNSVLDDLAARDDNDLVVFTTFAVPSDIREMTTNLAAPIIINAANNAGCQVILDGNDYGTRTPIFEYMKDLILQTVEV